MVLHPTTLKKSVHQFLHDADDDDDTDDIHHTKNPVWNPGTFCVFFSSFDYFGGHLVAKPLVLASQVSSNTSMFDAYENRFTSSLRCDPLSTVEAVCHPSGPSPDLVQDAQK